MADQVRLGGMEWLLALALLMLGAWILWAARMLWENRNGSPHGSVTFFCVLLGYEGLRSIGTAVSIIQLLTRKQTLPVATYMILWGNCIVLMAIMAWFSRFLARKKGQK